MNEWTNIEIMILVKVLFMVSVCVVIVSAVNYTAGNDKKQELQQMFIGLGMAVTTVLDGIFLRKTVLDGFVVALCIGIQIPVTGFLFGICVQKLYKLYFGKEKQKIKNRKFTI